MEIRGIGVLSKEGISGFPEGVFSVKQIINHFREAEVLLAQSKRVGEICRQTGVSEQSYYRWRRHYNTHRPHSALGYRPPAPKTILPNVANLSSAAQKLRGDRRFSDAVSSLN